MGTSWFGVGRSGATGLGRTAPEFSSLRLTRQPQTAVVDYKERLGIDDAVGLGDKFEVDKAVLAEALQKLLHNLRDGHEDAMRYKFRVRVPQRVLGCVCGMRRAGCDPFGAPWCRPSRRY